MIFHPFKLMCIPAMAMKLKGFLLVFLALNVYILCYYSLHFPSSGQKFLHRKTPLLLEEDQENPRSNPETEINEQQRSPSGGLKPWPELPSYMPWHPDPKPKRGSCEAYFGNGFNRAVQLLEGTAETLEKKKGGSFRCFYSETLETSICEARRLVMYPERIEMSRGGEDLKSVLGRDEMAELPSFSDGALQIEADANYGGGNGRLVSGRVLDEIIPTGQIHTHTMRNLIQSIRIVPPSEIACSQWIEEPTLLVTRFEYANLFHTYTDWYNAYVTSRVTDLPKRPRVVFVDGHCKCSMEEAWEALFTNITYAKHFSGPVCFRHALLTPLGYETALFKGLSERIPCHGGSVSELKQKPDESKTARLVEFGEMFRASFGLLSGESKNSRPSSVHNVLFLRREDYLAHPRHGGKVESRLKNEVEVLEALQKWAPSLKKCKVNIVNGLFAHMTMIDQVRDVQEASVIVAAHGAALTHIIAARPGTVVLEIISSYYRRPHFSLISQWTGLEYHAINLEGSVARCPEVVDVLGQIMKSLGC